jgi:uncharacterized membrane protein YfcA
MNASQAFFYAALAAAFIAFIVGAVRAAPRTPDRRWPHPAEIVVGFVTAFFDTLGIGSFAPTTAIFKLRRMVPDERIPGTLNVGLAAAACAEAVIFVGAIEVEPHLLISMILSAAAGSWLGADVVARLSRRAIQVTMGIALLIAVAVNFVLGALMSAGIGLYAPCMITLALLGMHPIAAFPIMMGACALLQPVASLRFFQTGKFAWGPSVGLTFGGIAGVLIAAFIVKSLPLEWLRWLVIIVILYASFAMMRSATQDSRIPATAGSTP